MVNGSGAGRRALSFKSPSVAACSLFQMLMLNCDISLLDPEIPVFEETASAAEMQKT